MRRIHALPVLLLLAGCAAPSNQAQVVTPEPTATTAVASKPSPETTTKPAPKPSPTPSPKPVVAESPAPAPDTSPAPTDAPPLLDTTALVRNLSTIDPAIAEAHGLLPTAYYPLVHNPDRYCSVEDITVCGTEEQILAAFAEWVGPELDEIQRQNEAATEAPEAPAESTQAPGTGKFTYDEAYAAWQGGMPYYDAFCVNYDPVTPGGVSQCDGIHAGTVDGVTGEYIGDVEPPVGIGIPGPGYEFRNGCYYKPGTDEVVGCY